MSESDYDYICMYVAGSLRCIEERLQMDYRIDPDEKFILLGKKFAYYDVLENMKSFKDKKES